MKTLIDAALAFWEHNTCITFEEYSSHAITPSLSYVNFQADGNGSRSGDIGFISNRGKHICNIDPPGATFYTITHEIGHILGLYHEQVRYDRANYVRIIKTESGANAIPLEGITSDKPYDFGSVMHYGHGDFWGDMVATAPYKLYSATMGNRQGPTYWDLRHVSQEYGCAAYHQDKCNDAHVTCGNNGYLHPNPAYCNVCVCPQGFAGTACEDLAQGDNGAYAYCGHVVWATDAWQALSSEITGVDPNYTGPPACCYHHIKTPPRRQVEIRVDSIAAGMHWGGHWSSGDVSHEHNHCVWGSLEIVFEDLTVSGAKICHEEDRDLFNGYPIKSAGNVVLLKNCAHLGRVAFSVS